jgi:circadian clock protein KaiC
MAKHLDPAPARAAAPQLPKAPTGIQGLDEITGGGLPRGRPTLVCGNAGCGKTLLAMEFVVRGATRYGEPGVFVAFEETRDELMQNVASLGFVLGDLEAQGKLVIDHVRVERSEIELTGEYDLEGLFIRIGHAIDTVGAKRVVLDTIETLFSGLSDTAVLRAELRRLFRWLKGRGVTAIITAERGTERLTRQGLEEYVSDCVIVLDHRVSEQVSTRRMRVVKYRGSHHGTNEYPFLIDENGISVLPLSALRLRHSVSDKRVSSGVRQLDEMLGGEGFFVGSTVLISGTPGVGKTTLCSHFAEACARAGERCLYFTFEESPLQIVRNMRSVGIDLPPWIDRGLLRIQATRPSFYGIEQHLTVIHKLVQEFRPQSVIVDPISNLDECGSTSAVRAMYVRLVDFLKGAGITAMMTNLTAAAGSLETTEVGVSSLVDTWILLRDIELGGERNHGLYILKSRGMPHSNQIREFVLSSEGVQLRPTYIGPAGVLTGSMRVAQEARESAAAAARAEAFAAKLRRLERRRQATEVRIEELRADLAAVDEEHAQLARANRTREDALREGRARMARSRGSDAQGTPAPGRASPNGEPMP